MSVQRLKGSRWLLLALFLLMMLASMPQLILRALAADNSKHNDLNVQLSTSNAAPREVEDTTEAAIVRDYSGAWKSMETALAQNNSGLLDAGFAGVALQQLKGRIADQQKAGMQTRFVDKGHQLDAVFYSPEGSAMELHDTAHMEIETLDGGKLIHSEQATLHYVALMTVAEDRWKVRVLQSVAGF